MTSALLLCAVALAPAQAAVNPGQTVSRMLARYFEAKSLSGTITLKAESEGVSTNVVTRLAVSHPDKLMIEQKGVRGTVLVVSDGETLRYHAPSLGEEIGPVLREPARVSGVVRPVRDQFAVSRPGLLDGGPGLNLVMGRMDDMQSFRSTILSLEDQGAATVNGKSGRRVGGQYAEMGRTTPDGEFSMVIGANGDLFQFVRREPVVVEMDGRPTPLWVTMTWDVNVVVDGPVDGSLFRVPR